VCTIGDGRGLHTEAWNTVIGSGWCSSQIGSEESGSSWSLLVTGISGGIRKAGILDGHLPGEAA
jgi:hypothetical protein